MIKWKCNPLCRTIDIENTPLHYASGNGHLNVVEYLITEHNCDPLITNTHGLTPLHFASAFGHMNVVKYLTVKYGCDPQVTCSDGGTPLHAASYYGHFDIVGYLIEEQQCSPECKTTIGSTPLYYACRNGYLDVVKYLIDKQGCDPQKTSVSSERISPLHAASMRGHTEVVEYLITTHQMNPEGESSVTPLYCACEGGHLDTVRYLISAHNCNPERVSEYKVSVNKRAVEEELANLDCDVLMPVDDDDRLEFHIKEATPLHAASTHGHLDVVKYLITECKCTRNPKRSIVGDDVSAVIEPLTPLDLSCLAGNIETVQYLLTVSDFSQIDLVNSLSLASMLGHIDVVKHLLPKYNWNSDFYVVLFTACAYGHLKIVKYLVDECGFDSHFADDCGQTLTHACAAIPHVFSGVALPQDIISNTDRTQGHFNAFLKLWKMVLYIILLLTQRLGIANPMDYLSLQELHFRKNEKQSKSNRLDIIKYLIFEKKCNPHCTDKDGLTPFHYACYSGLLDIVKYFENEKLGNLVGTTHSGDTPLHFACQSDQVEVAQFLLSTGKCDPLCKNAEGLTPLEITTSFEIRKLLDNFREGKYPLESIVKVFIVGNPLAGKSSLVQALQSNPGFIKSLIGQFQKARGVKQHTVGIDIDSFSFSSKDFGNIMVYDFAGQQEFHTSHAAVLQSSSSHLVGLFVVVVNIAQCEHDLYQHLNYWVSFIQECCAHSVVRHAMT